MRVINFEGKQACITERQWKGLVERYNPDTGYEPCTLCRDADTLCRHCPLYIFETEQYVGCIFLAKKLFGLTDLTDIAMFKESTYRKEATRIYEWLKQLPKKGGDE
ncbi:MAG: hypothetical protein DRO13_05745 [Thermoprotei archaeon]|nr:MAG: hypothetical protein DRO13_05745 [Thermoprotei archaeon]